MQQHRPMNKYGLKGFQINTVNPPRLLNPGNWSPIEWPTD